MTQARGKQKADSQAKGALKKEALRKQKERKEKKKVAEATRSDLMQYELSLGAAFQCMSLLKRITWYLIVECMWTDALFARCRSRFRPRLGKSWRL